MTSTSTTSVRNSSSILLLAVLMPSMLLTVIAADMVNLVLPLMGEQFGASEAELAWVVTGYLLVFSVGIPFYGRISDRVSLQRLFCFALLAYALGSLICALAPDLPILVIGRIVAGAGAAALPVLSIIAVTRLIPESKRGMGIGIVSAASGIGTAAGPAIGGGLGQWLGWPALFWLMFLIALVLLPAAWRVLPDEKPTGEERFDILGGILLGLGAGLALFGMTQVQVAGITAPTTWGSFVIAVVALGLFARRTLKVAHPFVPPALFANRTYRSAVVIAFLAMVVNLGGLVCVPLLVIDINDLDPGEGALVMIPAGIAVAAFSPLIGRLTDRLGTGVLVLTGLVVMGLCALFLSASAGATSVVPAGAGALGLCVGFVLVITPLINASAGVLPPDQVGVGLGILQGAQFLGAGAGPALFGVLLTARQHSDSAAINPLHFSNQGAAFSDTFLAMAVIIIPALIVGYRMHIGMTRTVEPAPIS